VIKFHFTEYSNLHVRRLQWVKINGLEYMHISLTLYF